jgi:amino acid adenylation domain-containing protein
MLHLAGYLEASAAAWPDRVAVVGPDGGQLTYRELNERAARVAGFLASRGVGPGQRVGLALPKSAAGVTALFGILKARAAYVPVDFSAPGERNRAIFTDCGVSALFVDRRALAALAPGPLPETVVEVAHPDAAALAPPPGLNALRFEDVLTHPAAAPTTGRGEGDLAYILYTSGSTGVPKGVAISLRAATSFVEWCSQTFAPTEGDRFSSHAPFHFDLSILDLYLPLKHGASVHLISEQVGQSPKLLAALIVERALTVWYSTPSILSVLVQFAGATLSTATALRLVLFAGEVFPIKHLRALLQALPRPAYYNLYGPTETNVCTWYRLPERMPDERTEPFPIGHLCSHCEGRVLDESGAEVARGEEGLLYIAGPSLFDGYWNRPEQSAAVFLERGGRRWYNTGDVVQEEAGAGYLYRGRKDRMVKRRGFRIELGEIETALYRHPSIEATAAVALPDPAAGTRIASFVVLRAGAQASMIELKAFCARNLPSYMSPDQFVFLPELPKTSTDKVDYQRLRAAVPAR